jgi:hypothetical protein
VEVVVADGVLDDDPLAAAAPPAPAAIAPHVTASATTRLRLRIE